MAEGLAIHTHKLGGVSSPVCCSREDLGLNFEITAVTNKACVDSPIVICAPNKRAHTKARAHIDIHTHTDTHIDIHTHTPLLAGSGEGTPEGVFLRDVSHRVLVRHLLKLVGHALPSARITRFKAG